MTATATSFSKNTVFVDAPPTGAPAGRFDKLEPSPVNAVAETVPFTVTPELVVLIFSLLLNHKPEDLSLV